MKYKRDALQIRALKYPVNMQVQTHMNVFTKQRASVWVCAYVFV